MAESQEEKAHWRSILRAFDGYMQYHVSHGRASTEGTVSGVGERHAGGITISLGSFFCLSMSDGPTLTSLQEAGL